YRSPCAIAAEGDASSASYFRALGASGGGPVRVTGVGADSIQGDVAFARTLADLGAQVEFGPDWIQARGVQVGQGQRLKAFDADFNLIPDAAMTAAALALYADGRSEEHTSELQSRENLVCRLLLEKKNKQH